MKIAVISDVHGNLLALRSCLKIIAEEDCDQIFCLGDILGYFPDGEACLDLLQDSGVELLMGNHEAMLLGLLPCLPEKDNIYQLASQRESLSNGAKCTIQKLLPYKTLEFCDGTRLLLVHGDPWNPLLGYIYPDSDLKNIAELPFNAIFMGHTHRPFIMPLSSTVLAVNVGSCGLPRDIGNQSAFVIYEVFSGIINLRRVTFDRQEVLNCYPFVHHSVKECLNRDV